MEFTGYRDMEIVWRLLTELYYVRTMRIRYVNS